MMPQLDPLRLPRLRDRTRLGFPFPRKRIKRHGPGRRGAFHSARGAGRAGHFAHFPGLLRGGGFEVGGGEFGVVRGAGAGARGAGGDEGEKGEERVD